MKHILVLLWGKLLDLPTSALTYWAHYISYEVNKVLRIRPLGLYFKYYEFVIDGKPTDFIVSLHLFAWIKYTSLNILAYYGVRKL